MAPKTAKLHQHEDGTIHALASDGKTVYTVQIGVLRSCTCPAGLKNVRCYHVRTAERRFPAFWPVLRKPVARRATADLLYA